MATETETPSETKEVSIDTGAPTETGTTPQMSYREMRAFAKELNTKGLTKIDLNLSSAEMAAAIAPFLTLAEQKAA